MQPLQEVRHVEKNYRNKNRHQANIAEEHDQEQCMFYATQDSIKEKGGSWYLDSGCSNHRAKDETIFKSIDESVKVKVRLGNRSVVESKGKGTVMVETDKEKSEVFGVFKKFKALAENQSGKQIKVLRSDRGKEYTSREFERFCEDKGIE
ncbi:uncharacterized protein LOC114391484 [Glycine soja]|uniref:uncharacterized protein LOC114391484 n=1 Tax=Glycine soja TaxID=3848 RepID=UPI001038C226|nr:uncharacterized protein LOC114391484 [Glycine soja]